MPDRARGAELLYGRNAVMEALRGRRSLRRLIVAEGSARQPRIATLIEAAARRRVPVQQVPHADLDRLLPQVNHQGVALEAGPYPYVALDALLRQAEGRPLLALDHIQDPQNLGTLMRTAEAVGAGGLLLPDRRAAGITPAVVNASAGAVEHLRVALVANLGRALEDCQAAGYWLVALEAGPSAQNLFTADVPEPAVLIVGSEGKGIAPSLLRRADLQVALPMLGRVESLNAAVAGSIALYDLLRRRLTAGSA
ncbi:MAG: 23S rRNA (guanosine(2251)-2'-O)-methyltransferase RlmB [Sphaerobacter sp.]|nr:23S rRNA (guanosine(2251)-2'-O)-methyltransferase RlmB [Sphaerobacter sp.]